MAVTVKITNQKKHILLALHRDFDKYKTFSDHEKALKHYCDTFDIKKKDVNEGYFKYFFKQSVLEGAFENKAHRIYKDLQKYLDQESGAVVRKLSAPTQPSDVTVNDDEDSMPAVDVNEWSPNDSVVDDNMFKYFLTNSEVDEIYSDDGGIMAATTIMLTGGPGVGKSTVAFAKAAKIREIHPDARIAIVSSEMEETDLLYECKRKPWMRTIKFILTSDYGPQLFDALRKIYMGCYDIIILDSFADTCEKLKDFCGMNMSKAENLLLRLMKRSQNGVGINSQGQIVFKPKKKEKLALPEFADITWTYTTTIAVQQVTKGGTFAGSNKLKHNTTGMLELRRESSGDRYMVFTKNRRCGQYVGKKLYYFLGANNQVSYDAERWEREKAGDTEDQPANLEQEGMTNQLLGQFGELNTDSMRRARALLMQADIPSELVALASPVQTQSLNHLPEGYDMEAIYQDTELDMYVLEIEGSTPIFGRTKADVINQVWARHNAENDSEETENEMEESN